MMLLIKVENASYACLYMIAVFDSYENFPFFAVRLGLRVSLTGPSEILDPQHLLSLYKEVSGLTKTPI